MKPEITIDLTGEDGNAFFMVAKAVRALLDAGQEDEANSLDTRFLALTQTKGSTYEQVKALVAEYCQVTWLNG